MSNVIKLERPQTTQERLEYLWGEQDQIRKAEAYLRKYKASINQELGELLAYKEV